MELYRSINLGKPWYAHFRILCDGRLQMTLAASEMDEVIEAYDEYCEQFYEYPFDADREFLEYLFNNTKEELDLVYLQEDAYTSHDVTIVMTRARRIPKHRHGFRIWTTTLNARAVVDYLLTKREFIFDVVTELDTAYFVPAQN